MPEETDHIIDPKILAHEAALLSFCLGKAMLDYAGILVHEMKVSSQKEMKNAYKLKAKELVKLHHSFGAFFKNANKYTSEYEKKHMQEAISGLLDGLWERKIEINEAQKVRPEIIFKIPKTKEDL